MMTFLLATLAIVTPTTASDDRLAGEWTLDFAASAFGADHQKPDYKIVRSLSIDGAIVVQADEITNMDLFSTEVPELRSKFTLMADGAEHGVEGLNRPPLVASNPVLPSKTIAIARWDGDNFIYAARGVDVVGPWSATHRLFVTDNGTRLVDVVTIVSLIGESERKYVFIRRK